MSTHPGKQRAARWLLFALVAALGGVALLLWQYTPLAQWAEPQRVAAWMTRASASPWAPAVVVLMFVLGGLVVFPLTLLITGVAVVFHPLAALVISLSGSMASALVVHALGRGLLRQTVTHAFGNQVQRLHRALANSGILAVAVLRMVPIAPFTVVNLAAGAIDVRWRDYVLGTLIGLLPGTVALTAFGHRIRAIVERPTVVNVALLVVVVLAWTGLSLWLQRLVSRRSGRTP